MHFTQIVVHHMHFCKCCKLLSAIVILFNCFCWLKKKKKTGSIGAVPVLHCECWLEGVYSASKAFVRSVGKLLNLIPNCFQKVEAIDCGCCCC
uniref:Uncharacterized protein n=1 Tax=Glossina palpalis gambiensis TaxID=67801 RepID=A0A1B0B4P9_9MUSC